MLIQTSSDLLVGDGGRWSPDGSLGVFSWQQDLYLLILSHDPHYSLLLLKTWFGKLLFIVLFFFFPPFFFSPFLKFFKTNKQTKQPTNHHHNSGQSWAAFSFPATSKGRKKNRQVTAPPKPCVLPRLKLEWHFKAGDDAYLGMLKTNGLIFLNITMVKMSMSRMLRMYCHRSEV